MTKIEKVFSGLRSAGLSETNAIREAVRIAGNMVEPKAPKSATKTTKVVEGDGPGARVLKVIISRAKKGMDTDMSHLRSALPDLQYKQLSNAIGSQYAKGMVKRVNGQPGAYTVA